VAKVVRMHGFGGPEVLRLDEVSVREPGPGEVRINVRAIGLNRAETMIMRGDFGQFPLPALLGYEAAGEIERVGPDVAELAAGDHVALLPGLPMNYGACGETILAPAELVVRSPRGQSHVEAAASWMPYLTAYAIRAYRPVSAGDAILITAASSSVGLAAIQIANALGAAAIAVTRSKAKAEALRRHGAAHVIVSEEQGVPAAVHQITEGRGAAIAFDAVGGPAFPTILASLAQGGLAIVYGSLGGDPAQFSSPFMSFRDLTIRGFATNHLLADARLRQEALAFVRQGLEKGELRPTIARTFRLTEIVAAYRYLLGNQQVGKIVVTP
jgi:NADPH2:quinone reductase